MSKGLYPTNDGHIGNIKKLTTLEVMNLIKRHENLIKKKSLLTTLPDKGARNKLFLWKLQEELSLRSSESIRKPDCQIDAKMEETTSNGGLKNIQDEIKQPSENVKSSLDTNMTLHEDGNLMIDPQHTLSEGLDCHKTCSNDTCELAETLKNLSVTDGDVKGGKHKHFFEIAVERSKANILTRSKEPLKLNRTLKVESVKELPEEIQQIKSRMPAKICCKQPHKSVANPPQESAAAPPHYKFQQSQFIDLQESLHLQQLQKQRMEELQAEMASQKLSERLHIKIETYNPEGINMSYRSSVNSAIDIDSDDDFDEDDNALQNTSSDSDD